MTTTIQYVDSIGPYTLRRSMPKGARRTMWGTFYPGQGADGYGRKISTDIVLRFEGETRPRRVYATCFSNAATHWIVYKGATYYLPTIFQSDIED